MRRITNGRGTQRRYSFIRITASLLFALILWLPAVRLSYGMPTRTAPQAVPFKVIIQGNVGETTAGPCVHDCWLVVTSRRQFDRLWPGAYGSLVPPVDFTHYALVVTEWGGVSGGYTFRMTRVMRVGRQLQVHVRRGYPLTYSTDNIEYPIVIAEVPRPFTGVQFIIQTDTSFCTPNLLDVCRTAPADNRPTSLLQPRPPCGTPIPNTGVDHVSCYSPGATDKAAALLHPHGIDPSSAVTRLTGLRLRRVIDAQWTLTGLHNIWEPHLLLYHYGTAPTTMDKLDFTPHKPTFVEVAETGDRPFNARPPRPLLEQPLIHLGITFDPPSNGTIVKGPWEFEAKIPHHKLWITVAADGSRSTVRHLGEKILHALS